MTDATQMKYEIAMQAFHGLQREIWRVAEDHGFHEAQRVEGKPWIQATIKLALIVTEIGEALEALRKDNQENFREELADIFIRLLDLAEECDINLIGEVEKKHEKNKLRPHLHDKRF